MTPQSVITSIAHRVSHRRHHIPQLHPELQLLVSYSNFDRRRFRAPRIRFCPTSTMNLNGRPWHRSTPMEAARYVMCCIDAAHGRP